MSELRQYFEAISDQFEALNSDIYDLKYEFEDEAPPEYENLKHDAHQLAVSLFELLGVLPKTEDGDE